LKQRLSPVLIFAGIVNFVLFFIKFYIGIRTNSQCIYTDSINNLMDTLSLCLAIVGISFINKPATTNFQHGFGRMEDLTSFVMSLIMTVAGLGFAYTSLIRILSPIPVWYFTKYAVIIGVTCIVKLFLGVVFSIRYKKENSTVIKTVMLDSFLDCGITAVTIVSFTLSNYIGFMFDAFLGLVISIIIAIAGIKLIISSIGEILGKHNEEIHSNAENVVLDICKSTSFSLKDLKIHSYGAIKNYVTLSMVSTEENIAEMQKIQNTIKSRLEEMGYSSTIEWEVTS